MNCSPFPQLEDRTQGKRKAAFPLELPAKRKVVPTNVLNEDGSWIGNFSLFQTAFSEECYLLPGSGCDLFHGNIIDEALSVVGPTRCEGTTRRTLSQMKDTEPSIADLPKPTTIQFEETEVETKSPSKNVSNSLASMKARPTVTPDKKLAFETSVSNG
eukprot:scaffold21455_cov116-Cylindrotheca_fusiformis.AAC.10